MVRCLCRVGACRFWALAVPRGARGGLFVWLRPPKCGQSGRVPWHTCGVKGAERMGGSCL